MAFMVAGGARFEDAEGKVIVGRRGQGLGHRSPFQSCLLALARAQRTPPRCSVVGRPECVGTTAALLRLQAVGPEKDRLAHPVDTGQAEHGCIDHLGTEICLLRIEPFRL